MLVSQSPEYSFWDGRAARASVLVFTWGEPRSPLFPTAFGCSLWNPTSLCSLHPVLPLSVYQFIQFTLWTASPKCAIQTLPCGASLRASHGSITFYCMPLYLAFLTAHSQDTLTTVTLTRTTLSALEQTGRCTPTFLYEKQSSLCGFCEFWNAHSPATLAFSSHLRTSDTRL